MCFATKGIFAKLVYAAGWDWETVLVVRAAFALPILWAWALWKVGAPALLRPPRTAVLGAAAAGVFCYYLGTLLNFYALTLIDASIERVLLFAYPSFVVVLYSVLYRERPAASVLLALALTYVGIVMVVSGFDLAVLGANLHGAGLVLGCALTFAVYYLASDRWTRSIGSIAFTVYALTAATACLLVHHFVRTAPGTAPWSADTALLMGGLVVVGTVLPMLSMAEGVRRLGAQRAAVVSTIGPPTTILLGAWLLDERLTLAQWLGVALIVAGIIVLEVLRRKAPAPAPD